MDFDFEASSNKPSAVPSHLEKGGPGEGGLSHSPLGGVQKSGDKLQKGTSGSGSTDDFEHVDHDPFMSDSGLPSSSQQQGSQSSRGAGDSGLLLDDFLGDTQKHFDSFKSDLGNEFSHVMSSAKDMSSEFMPSLNDKIAMTNDFMSAERGGFAAPKPAPSMPAPVAVPAPAAVPISPVTKSPPAQPIQQNLFDMEPGPVKEEFVPAPVVEDRPLVTPAKVEIPAAKPSAPAFEQASQDINNFFDSPVKKISKEDNEKFISSEDLLGDFSDARRTPEPALPVLSKPEPVKAATAPPASHFSDFMQEPVAAPAVAKPTQPKDEPKLPEPTPAPQPSPKPEEISFAAMPPKATAPEIPKVAEAPKPVAAPAATTAAAVPAKKSTKPMISAEEIFYKYGLDAWFKPDRLHPVVESLIYWRDVKKSGIVFGAGLVTLLAISCFSVISVIAYLSLLSLAGTIAFRIYKNVLGAIQKTSEGHPFKEFLEFDLTISQEKAQNVVSVVVAHINGFVSELRRLFLVDDLVDSIKFGVILWVLTYIGAWFNGMTLVILAFVALFTLPKVYENNKQSIDTYLDLVRSKIMEITDKVKAAIPIGKKPETDKDK